ncbi:amidohydrolase family protein [Streptomyces sp. NPDC004539]|uniref:amidohydrolase family protein n=1 Tax=Streptomyces sp. NPDC004539 TaxID=3154280 RepID=UPI0033BE8B47
MRGELLALKAGHVFDGARVGPSGMLLVEDGMILDVDFTGSEPPFEATTLDFGPDAWLLPGFVDAHVHLCWDGTKDAVAHVTSDDRETLLDVARENAARSLDVGVTTVRDLGDRDYLTLELRDRLPAVQRPEIVASGPPLTSRGGHCHFLGGEAEGADELLAAVRERAERGCEVVKVMAGGGDLTPGDSPLMQQYHPDDLRLVIAEARRLGLTTAAHAHGTDTLAEIADLGFHSLEHVSFLTRYGVGVRRAVLDEVVRRGTFVSLSAGVFPEYEPVLPEEAARFGAMDEIVASGARIVPGTDSGVTAAKAHGVYPYALVGLARYGMPHLDVLRAATRGAAEAVGLGGTKGALRPGADADIVVLGSSPLDDIGAVVDVRAVYRAGERVR